MYAKVLYGRGKLSSSQLLALTISNSDQSHLIRVPYCLARPQVYNASDAYLSILIHSPYSVFTRQKFPDRSCLSRDAWPDTRQCGTPAMTVSDSNRAICGWIWIGI